MIQKHHETQCVRCGKCLAKCRYYREKRVEHLSPRGRIILAKTFLEKGENNDLTEFVESVYCLGCLDCADSCPYQSSPLHIEEISFVWEDGETYEPGFKISDFFNLIYRFRSFGDMLQKRWEGKNVSDFLIYSWLFKRGINTNFSGTESDIHYKNGALYNPFLSIEMELNQPGLKTMWEKIIRRKSS